MAYGSSVGAMLPVQRARGTGDIAVSYRPGVRFALAYLKVHFLRLSGSGTEVAAMTVDVANQAGTYLDAAYNHRIKRIASAGVSFDVFIRAEDTEIEKLVFEPDQCIRVNWTNPETTNEIEWGLELGCVQIT